MHETGISLSVVSMPAPGANIFPSDASQNAAVARLTDEFMFALAETYPGLFNFLANVPLPYIDESITETTYALDHLNASGVGLFSSHEGQYHGAPSFARYYAFANERGVGIFYHPTLPLQRNPAGALVPSYPSYGFVYAPFEFLFDTARNVMNLTAAHTMRDNKNLKFGFAHCAGAFASIGDRYFQVRTNGPEGTWEANAETFQTRYVGPTHRFGVMELC